MTQVLENAAGLLLRPSSARGLTQTSWLHSRHSFSFGHYQDPQHHSFGVLRVINDDVIQKDGGFGAHPHRDMEIITYVVTGAVAHRDSLGSQGLIPQGDVQHMSAGTGIVHSEFNGAPQASRFIQMWIEPDQSGYAPRYQQQAVSAQDKNGRWLLLASPEGEDGLLTIYQDARLYAAALSGEQTLTHVVKPNRWAWLQVVSGSVWVNQMCIEAGDGLAVTSAMLLQFNEAQAADLLLFDVPAA
jgi:hypothetical protein